MISHLIKLFVAAFFSTLLPLPVAPVVLYFYGVIATGDVWFKILTVVFAAAFDTISAVIVYFIFLKFNYTKFAGYVSHIEKIGPHGQYIGAFINTKVLTILEDQKSQNTINKYGSVAIFIASATPFPFSVTLYAAGIVKYERVYFLAASVFVGRLINYTLMALIGIGILKGIR